MVKVDIFLNPRTYMRVKLIAREKKMSISEYINIILEKEIKVDKNKKIVISGFGVGLSWGSAIIEKYKI